MTYGWFQCDELGCQEAVFASGRPLRTYEGREWVCLEHEEAA